MLCDHCRTTIYEDQPTCTFSFGVAKRGKKSGQVYPSQTMERPYDLHQVCLLAFLQADSDMQDMMYNYALEKVRQDEVNDLKQIALDEAAKDLENLCPACASDKTDPDSPPDEYQCSDCGSGALPVCPDCGTVSDLAADFVNQEEERTACAADR